MSSQPAQPFGLLQGGPTVVTPIQMWAELSCRELLAGSGDGKQVLPVSSTQPEGGQFQ